ncbi:hypothetical protein [Bacteroides sp. An19]|uniref:hypothetical protein n=1 Tax=Bacteroides sp. An19 TaxID=1965580 RepID=UPI000B3A708B|nr:hypothetical protein [Bacteroides sp. An19]OUP32021.1 hypothetical protein B5F25_09800 [Bacteroides sp. An19]
MADDKIKIKDIEGAQKEVIDFFKNSGLDIGDYINSARKIKIPLWSIATVSVLFFIVICVVAVMGDSCPKIKTILILLSVALAFLNICLVYMCWKNNTLTGIIALAEVILFSLSLYIYTPKEIIKKIEDKVNKI